MLSSSISLSSRLPKESGFDFYSTPLEVYNNLPGKVTITEFESGHGWNSNAGGSQNYNDTTDPIIGTQHFSLVTNPAGTYKYCQRTTLASTVDMTGKNMAILMKVDDVSKLDEMQLFLFNGGGTTVYRKYSNMEGSQSTKWFYNGEWCLFTFGLDGSYADTGAFDISAVTGIRIAFDDDNTGAVTVYLQAVALFTRTLNKYVTIMFDDGNDSVYDLALGVMNTNSLVGTIAVPHDVVGTGSYMTLAELQALKNAGWELAAHSTGNDQTADNEATVRAYLAAGKLYWSQNGFNPVGWVYAGGEYGAVADNASVSVKDIASDTGFKWARSINEASYEYVPAADPMKLRVIYVTNADSAASVNALIDEAHSTGGWPILIFHRIVEATADETTKYLLSDFTTIVEHIAGISGVVVQNPTQILKANQKK